MADFRSRAGAVKNGPAKVDKKISKVNGRGVIFQREISVIFQRGILVFFQRRRAASALLLVLLGLLGFWVSWFLGFLVSGFPGLGFLVSGFPGLWVSWFLGFWVSWFLGIPTLNKET